MAVVTLNPMFETSSGSLRKPVKRNGHNHGEYLLTTHRVAATTNPNCQRAYTPPKDRYDRVTPLGSNELWARERFGAVCAAVALRKKDLTKVAQDNAAFLAQKDQAGGKKTLKAYLWSLEIATYDQAHPRS